mmetsp:Transcript_13755/g.30296  ORF Transcript_13755/g.30296 Transcript_13755/m.30296 type:complete len:199 (+) Transcript_13755:72-668(+)
MSTKTAALLVRASATRSPAPSGIIGEEGEVDDEEDEEAEEDAGPDVEVEESESPVVERDADLVMDREAPADEEFAEEAEVSCTTAGPPTVGVPNIKFRLSPVAPSPCSARLKVKSDLRLRSPVTVSESDHPVCGEIVEGEVVNSEDGDAWTMCGFWACSRIVLFRLSDSALKRPSLKLRSSSSGLWRSLSSKAKAIIA